MSRPSQVAQRVHEVLDPVVRGVGLYLEDVRSTAGKHTVVRVVVDLPDGPGGLGSDALTEVSRDISAALDDSDVVPGAYTLEVSTPGVSRPLTTERHFRRAVGRLVRLSTAAGQARGRLTAVDGSDLVVDVDGASRTVPLVEVTSGAIEAELGRPADHADQG